MTDTERNALVDEIRQQVIAEQEEARRQYRRDWYARNREHISEYRKQWYKDHKCPHTRRPLSEETLIKIPDVADTVFKSVHGTHIFSGISEYRIRNDIRDGIAPYIMCGKKYMIDYQGYIANLKSGGGYD